jgi:hypothetical protein
VSRSTTDLLFKLILHDFPGGVQRESLEEFDVSWRFEPDVIVTYDDRLVVTVVAVVTI